MVSSENFEPMVEYFDPFKEPFTGEAGVAFSSSSDVETCSACSACSACSGACACTACGSRK